MVPEQGQDSGFRKDDLVLELEVEAGCEFILTYNERDFAGVEQFGVKTLTPKEFLQRIGEIPS